MDRIHLLQAEQVSGKPATVIEMRQDMKSSKRPGRPSSRTVEVGQRRLIEGRDQLAVQPGWSTSMIGRSEDGSSFLRRHGDWLYRMDELGNMADTYMPAERSGITKGWEALGFRPEEPVERGRRAMESVGIP